MPRCEKCGKESKNLRVCPFCFTPYRTSPGSAGRSASSMARQAAGGGRFQFANLSPAVKFGVPLAIVAFIMWFVFAGREPGVPVGVVAKEVITTPMSKAMAEAFVRQINASATVERRGNDITVTFQTASWPERKVGQLALAQEYARAVDIVEGARRNIKFLDPSGSQFAKADAAGVTMLK
jgi:hypothetical protein